jgi:hypothetical protein
MRRAIDQRHALELYVALCAGAEPDGSYLEARWKRPGRSAVDQRKFLPVHARAAMVDLLGRQGARTDVYLGVNPRVRESGHSEDVERAWVAHVDCDTPDAYRALTRFAVRPSMVIRSGGRSDGIPHVHAYWQLRPALGRHDVEALNRALAEHLGADPQVHDAARILRPPATLSHKHGGRPVVCTLLRPVAHDPDRLRAAVPTQEPAPPRIITPRPASDDPLRGIPAAEYVPALTGRDIGRDGKVRCPFHGGGQERTPSLHVYADGWACFGCPPLRPDREHAGGDIYTFAALLYGLGEVPRGAAFHDLRRRLLQDLGMAVAA